MCKCNHFHHKLQTNGVSVYQSRSRCAAWDIINIVLLMRFNSLCFCCVLWYVMTHIWCLFLMRQKSPSTTSQEDDEEVVRFPTQETPKWISFGLYAPSRETKPFKWAVLEDTLHSACESLPTKTHMLLHLSPLSWCDHLQNCVNLTQLDVLNWMLPFCHRSHGYMLRHCFPNHHYKFRRNWFVAAPRALFSSVSTQWQNCCDLNEFNSRDIPITWLLKDSVGDTWRSYRAQIFLDLLIMQPAFISTKDNKTLHILWKIWYKVKDTLRAISKQLPTYTFHQVTFNVQA